MGEIRKHKYENTLDYWKKIHKKSFDIFNKGVWGKLIIVIPKSKDKKLNEANRKYVRSKTKHLLDVGYEVKIVNEESLLSDDIVHYCFGTEDIKYKVPVLIQKTEDFDKYCEILKNHDRAFNIEFENTVGTTPTARGGILMLASIIGDDLNWIKNVLIIGRSKLVGMPTYNHFKMLVEPIIPDVKINIAHSKTCREDLVNMFWEADVVFVGVGNRDVLNFVGEGLTPKTRWKNKVIIDYGCNVINGKMKGDVDIDKLEEFIKMVGVEDYEIDISDTPAGTGLSTIDGLIGILNSHL